MKLGMRLRLNESQERLQRWVAWRLPRWLVYWATIRLLAHATTGEYGSTCATELTGVDALKRWGTKGR